jgi:hypothetical protein
MSWETLLTSGGFTLRGLGFLDIRDVFVCALLNRKFHSTLDDRSLLCKLVGSMCQGPCPPSWIASFLGGWHPLAPLEEIRHFGVKSYDHVFLFALLQGYKPKALDVLFSNPVLAHATEPQRLKSWVRGLLGVRRLMRFEKEMMLRSIRTHNLPRTDLPAHGRFPHLYSVGRQSVCIRFDMPLEPMQLVLAVRPASHKQDLTIVRMNKVIACIDEDGTLHTSASWDKRQTAFLTMLEDTHFRPLKRTRQDLGIP